MRVFVVLAIALAIGSLLAVPLAVATISAGPVNIGIPYVFTPGFTFASPFASGSMFMQAFNTSTLARTDTEVLAIAFPATAGWSFMPTIAQTASRDIVATKTYFFNDVVSAAA